MRIALNEMMQNCMDWVMSLGWVGLLPFIVPVVGVAGLVMAWARQIRHSQRQ
jgi:hypothetical protein